MTRRAQLEFFIKEAMGMGNIGAEEVARVQLMAKCRATGKVEMDQDFTQGKKTRQGIRAQLESLFIQTPAAAAENGSPALSKISSADCGTVMGALKKKSFEQSKRVGHGMIKLSTPHLDAFFEKLSAQDGQTEAQKRYPELLKVSAPFATSVARAAPGKKPAGALPARSILSGGQA